MTLDFFLPLAFVVFVGVEAVAQGKLSAITRDWVPQDQSKHVNLPLHYLYPCLYVLFTAMVAGNAWTWVFAGLVRLAFFDPVLNAAKALPLYTVGTSSATDKILRKLYPAKPERLSMIIRVSAAAVAVGMLFFKS